MVYENGRIPASALSWIQSGHYLTPVAARSWLQVIAGVKNKYGWIPQVTDSYRPYAAQVKVFLERYERRSSGLGPYGDVRWWDSNGDGAKERWVRVRGAAAAVPGTSNHGQGTAVDVTGLGKDGSLKYMQFADVAKAHGWSNVEGRSVNEPWHWTKNSASFVNNPNQIGGSVPSAPPDTPVAPITPIIPEDDVPSSRLLLHPNGTIALAGEDATFVVLTSMNEADSYRAVDLIKPGDGPSGTFPLADGMIWNMLGQVAARKAAMYSTDPAKVAASVAAILVPAVLSAVQNAAPANGLTEDELRAITEEVIRDVLGSLG